MFVIVFLWIVNWFFPEIQVPAKETLITGVYQGKALFIQNPYDPASRTFCIEEISVNDRKVPANSSMSAIVLDFGALDLFTPVNIKIIHKDSCSPVIINPDAIFFHTTFSFKKIAMTDSALVWHTVGDKKGGYYVVEKFSDGVWADEEKVEAAGVFEGADYLHYPTLEVGANKYRVRYHFPDRKYLYSREIDFHFYPDPVRFEPKKTDSKLTLSRPAFYQVYDAGGTLVLEGNGVEVDVRKLPEGDYVIYFDGKDPGAFTKE